MHVQGSNTTKLPQISPPGFGFGEGDGAGDGVAPGEGEGEGAGLAAGGGPRSSKYLSRRAVLPQSRNGPVLAADKLLFMYPRLEATRSKIISALRTRGAAAGAVSASVLMSSASLISRICWSLELYARHSGFQPEAFKAAGGLRDKLGLSLRLISAALALMLAVLYCRAKV